MGTELVRVAVIEDHTMPRNHFASVIEHAPDFVLDIAVSSVEEFEVRTHKADVIVLDLHLPGGGLERAAAVAYLTEKSYHVLVLTGSTDTADLIQAMAAGARGYLTKNASEKELLTALRALSSGEIHLSATITANQSRQHAPFSKRENEVLELLAEGMANKDIARQLGVSPRTVEKFLTRSRDKIDKSGVRSRGELIRHEKGNTAYLLGSAPALFVSLVAAVSQIIDYLQNGKISITLFAVAVVAALVCFSIVIARYRRAPRSNAPATLVDLVVYGSLALAALSVLTMAVLFVLSINGTATSSVVPAISIPAASSTVPEMITVEGTAAPSDVADGELWLMLEIDDDHRLFAGEGRIVPSEDGNWRAPLYVGGRGDQGRKFRIHLVTLAPATVEAVQRQKAAEAGGQNPEGFDVTRLRELGVSYLASVAIERQ